MQRFYRYLLLLYPPAHRREYGAEMIETFALRADEARRSGVGGDARFLCREAGGAVRSALRESREHSKRALSASIEYRGGGTSKVKETLGGATG